MARSLDVFPVERSDESLAKLLGQFLVDLLVLAPAVHELFETLGRIMLLELGEDCDQMMHAGVSLLGACFEKVEEFSIVS